MCGHLEMVKAHRLGDPLIRDTEFNAPLDWDSTEHGEVEEFKQFGLILDSTSTRLMSDSFSVTR